MKTGYLIKTMNDKGQKIIYRWNYERARPTWTTESSNNISKVWLRLAQ
jgi:hypothetical protein